jgi:excisionase family DNA binding protein
VYYGKPARSDRCRTSQLRLAGEERRLTVIMGEAGKDTDDLAATTDATRKCGNYLAESIKERLSPAVEIWVKLIADVIADEVLREHRAKPDSPRPSVVGSASETRRPERGSIPRDDQGQKVVTPRGRLLTIQEAADYLALSRASLAGRGWRIKNQLPAIKVGRSVRFDKDALDRWIDRHRERLPRSFGTTEDE